MHIAVFWGRADIVPPATRSRPIHKRCGKAPHDAARKESRRRVVSVI